MNKFDMEKNEDNYCKNLAIKIFDDIADLTKDNQGVTRESYGKGEDKAIKYLENLANDLGLFIEVDECANVIFSINENKNNSEISKSMGISSTFYFNKLMNTSKKVPINRLKNIHNNLLEFDLKCKTSSFEKELELELLLLST